MIQATQNILPWTPATQINQPDNDTIVISPISDTTRVILYATNGYCYNATDSVSVYIKGRAYAGNDTSLCRGDIFNLLL